MDSEFFFDSIEQVLKGSDSKQTGDLAQTAACRA